MQKALIGTKKGMTQIFDKEGLVVPVTIIDISDSYLVKAEASEEGESTLILGYGVKKSPKQSEEKKYSDIKKVPRNVRVFKLDSLEKYSDLKPGDALLSSVFEAGDFTQVSSKTKGKGFQGVVKRWGFAGGPKTHGQSDRLRAPGSIGGGTDPGRVYKGKKMAGHMGNKFKTVMNLKVVEVDNDNGLLFIKGAVPGPKGSLVEIRESSLKTKRNTK